MVQTALNSVKFDPGYAQHTTILSINVEYIYAKINSFKNLGQKKFQFKMNYSQLQKMAENNVGFCLGCILWAVYIKSLGDVNIEGNPCLGDTFDKQEAVEEIDYSVEFFDRLKKDAKYYLGQNYDCSPLYITILDLYRDFLLKNSSFVNTKTTNDLILPDKIKMPQEKDLKTIKSKIDEVIDSGNLLDLTDVFELVYEG